MANQLLFMPTPEDNKGWEDARATSELAQVDHEGIIRFTPVGKLPFEKARIVKNLLADVSGACSEDLTSLSAIGSPTLTATQFTPNAQWDGVQFLLPATIGEQFILSVDVRLVSGTSGDFNLRHFRADADTTSINASLTGTLQRFSVLVTCDQVGGIFFGIRERGSVAGNPVYEVTNFQVENVTGQSNKNPSEYCPVWSNLVTDSIPDSTNWTTNGLTSITGNSIKSPSGAYDAPLFTENTTTTWHGAYSPVFSVTNGKSYTHSCYAKAGTEGVLQITTTTTYSAFDTQDYANFDLSNGVIGSAGTGASNHSITDVGNGWYFCTVDFSAQATVGSQVIVLAFTGNNTSITRLSSRAGSSLTLYIWGAAVAENFAADYMVDESGFAQYSTANGNTVNATTKVVTEATGSALSPVPYLVHVPAATNLFPYSEDITQINWDKSALLTPTLNQAISPNGKFEATSIVPDTTSAAHYFRDLISVTIGTDYCTSIYVKPNGYNYLQIAISSGFDNNQNNDYQNFYLSGSGSLGNGSLSTATAGIEALDNGWYRCWVEDVATTTGNASMLICVLNADTATRLATFTGDGTSGVYIWCAQFEATAFPTPAIQTNGGSASRNATAIQTPLDTGAGGNFNQDQGAFSMRVKLVTKPTATQGLVALSGAATSTFLYWNAFGVFYSHDSTSAPAIDVGNWAEGDIYDIGLRYDTTSTVHEIGYQKNDGGWAIWESDGQTYDGSFDVAGTHIEIGKSASNIFEIHDLVLQDAVATIAEIEAGLPVSGASNDIAAALQVALAANSDIDATGKLIVSQSIALTLAAQFEAAGGLDAALSVVFNAVSDVDAIGQLSAVQAIVTTMAANLNSIGKSEAALSLLLNISPGITNSASSDLSASVNIALATLVDINANGKLTSSQTLLLSVAANLTAIGDINSAVAMLFVITTDIANGASSDMSAGIAAALTTSYDISAISSLIASNQVSVIATPDIYGAGSLTSGFFITVTISGDIAHVVFIENNNLVFSEIIRGYEFEEIERGYTFS